MLESEFERGVAAVRVHLATGARLTNRDLRLLTGLSYDRAIVFFNRAVQAGVLRREGKGSGTHCVLANE
jgi:hypothetical protein